MRWNPTPKYKNSRCNVNGISFHSRGEADRYLALLEDQELGLISDLTLQPRFPMIVNGTIVCTYIADFQYVGREGKIIVEDFKGMLTPEYKIKAKFFIALYPQYIYLVSKKRKHGYSIHLGGVVRVRKVKKVEE